MNDGNLGKLYLDGEVIVSKGDVGDCMYVVQSGTVEVLTGEGGKETRLRLLGQGEIIGEMSLLGRQTRSATVRAKGEARLLTIDKKTFLNRIQEDPTIAFNLIRMMSERIRELSSELVRLRSVS